MLSALSRSCSAAASCSYQVPRMFYSTAPVRPPRRRNWRVPTGHPSPKPITSTEPDPPTSSTRASSSELPTLGAPTRFSSDAEPQPLAEELPLRARTPAALHPKPGQLPPTPPEHAAHTRTLREQFPEGWAPPRKLSRETMDGLRALHRHDPRMFTTAVLAARFRVSPEAVRRILKSRWEPTREVRARMAERDKREREAWIEKRRMEERKRRIEVRNEMEKDTLTMV